MSPEPDWVKTADVIALNRAAVAVTGENHQVLNHGALDSAVNNPRHLHHYNGETDIGILAFKLMIALCRAHAFEQGNKRTAWLAGVMFLQLNGYDIDLSVSRTETGDVQQRLSGDTSAVQALAAQQLMAIITRQIPDEEFYESFEPFIVPL